MIKQASVQELKEKLENSAEGFVLIDCRESDENEYCCIEGSKCLPLSEFQKKALEELKPEQEVWIHCHHGGRSQKACEFLQDNGFENLTNVTGGIDKWSLEIDSKVPRY